MKKQIIEILKERNFTVDYIDTDEEKTSYQIYTDDCTIMCCIDFYGNGNVKISPAYAEEGIGKCTDNSEDEFYETETNESDEYYIVRRIENMIK